MHYLSLCAIFKHENPWLVEWLNYHIFRGVEHFYLYNNDDDPTESNKILLPYVESGIVDNIRVQSNDYPQVNAYKDAVASFAQETFWLGIIDMDEFILPRWNDNICEFLEDYESYSGLAIHWNIFGSNGYRERPTNQIDHFLRRAEEGFENHKFVKSIVKPNQVVAKWISSPHVYPFWNGYAVDENHRPNQGTMDDYSATKIRINHYCVRSRQDFDEVKVPRGVATPADERNASFWDVHDRNEVFDNEISRRFGYFSESFQTIVKDRLARRIQRPQNPTTVLLTGSVIQNYPHLLKTGIQNPEERLQDYLCSIMSWLELPEIEHVIYCDAGGFTLPEEVFQNKKFCSLALDLKGLCLENGKGAAEMASVEYAMQTSNFPSENFFKCTGRVFVKNFSEIWQQIAPPENHFYLNLDHDHQWCDTRFFWLNRNMYHRNIRPHLHEMSDYGGPFLEHLFARYCADAPPLPFPVLVGRSAYSGQRYQEDYTQEIKDEARSLIDQYSLLESSDSV